MAAIDYIDLVVMVITLIIGFIAGAGGFYLAGKKFIINLADALEDDVITRDELLLLLKDALGLFNIIKHVIKK